MIDFKQMPDTILPHFKGGKETFFARFAGDASCKILYGRLPAGATIGLHTHEDTAEIIFFLSGTGKMLLDGEEETIQTIEVYKKWKASGLPREEYLKAHR